MRPGLDELVQGVRAGHRASLGRAITLVESRSPVHQDQAALLLERLMPWTGGAWRVGVTGVPGVGKSTFIDALGSWLTGRGHKVAVLAVDPSSVRSGGSILGDKTRMQRLSVDPAAFVRPSPSGGTLGGVASRSREALLVCEAAGFDVVLVETVGVGQSELAVAEMTDFFLVLMLAGAGDELQGIKRGLMELCDCLAVNKADGDNLLPAQRAAATYAGALRLLRSSAEAFPPRVQTVSSLSGAGIPEIWQAVVDQRAALVAAGTWEERRSAQRVRWLWDRLDDGLRQALRGDPGLRETLAQAEAQAAAGHAPPTVLARALLARFLAAR
ncbi:methylmalonyl Co-A mutase-associated GTPase MeaB [Myxococcota bacterium]|nr:methylmalonyl Co-A mutase-associated GTPase MeaB [Myxococcota bacterium]